jgi:ribosomal protein S18 acetylase RimI-like enzyme
MDGWPASEVRDRFAAGRRCFVARVGGEIASYGWVTPGGEWIGELDREVRLDPDEAYIWQCATAPAHQRRGLYKALLAGMLLALAREGFRRVWIGAALANTPSVKAFASLGLTPVLMVDYRRLGPVSCFFQAAFAGADPGSVAHVRAGLESPREQGCGPVRIAWGPRPHA